MGYLASTSTNLMIGIRSITVNTYDLDSLTVVWEYEHSQPGVDLSSTTIDIQRSESDDFSNYTTIAAGLAADSYDEYTDSLLSGVITRRYNDMNYRVRFVEPTGAETITDIVWLTDPINLRAKDIIRRKNIVLGLHGRDLVYFKRKTHGPQCTECIDEILETQTTGNCTTCYNTGFTGGFYSQIAFKGFITSSPDINTVDRFGEVNPGQVVLSIAAYPRIAVNDVIVDMRNRRWWVSRVANVRHKDFTVSQDAVLSLVDHNDAVYDLVVT